MSDLAEGATTLAPETSGNPLYDACVGFMVSERTGTDSWEQVAMHVNKMQQAGLGMDSIRTEFRTTEQQIKKDFSVSVLPTAWRTAKHTALKAVRNGVPLLGGDGKVLGKTAVDKGSAVPRNKHSPYETAFYAIDTARVLVKIATPINCLERAALIDRANILVQDTEALTCA